MKKLKLLLTAFALLGGVNLANAIDWTDKTSLITNPSFETDEAISNLTTCGWATDRATGWTIAPNSPGNSQVGIGNSSSTIQGIASSFSPSAGDKYFYMRENWNPNTTFSVSQTIPDGSIPAGIYRLTVKAAMFSSYASTYTLSLQEEGQTAATNSFSYAGTANSESWRDWSVMLVKRADDTDLTITAAYKTPSNNEGSKHYALLLDDVKLEYLTGVTSENTFDMTSWIVNPSFELNTFTGTQDPGSSIAENNGTINKPTGYTCYFNVEGWRDCSANTTAPADGTYCMNSWFGTIREQKFYQTIDYLPEGVYEISAKVRTDQTETTGIYTYGIAGGNTYKSDSWDASKMAGTWNSMENWQTLTARASVIGGGSLQFGVRSDKFIQFDDFHLTYLGSDLLLSEATAAWNTAHTALAALNATALPDAAETAITTELAKACPGTLAEIESATTALQALIDSYDGIKAAFDEYKALKAIVEDLKNTSKYTFTGDDALSTFNSTLSTIDGDAEAATDAATLTALLPTLKTAGNTFVGAIDSDDGFDLTYNVVNNSFETGSLDPWTTNGSNDTGVRDNGNATYTTTDVDGSYLFNTWNNGNGSKVSQTLSSLPEGYYTVTALVASDAGNTINILAGATTKTIDADGSGKTQFVGGTTDKTLVSDGSLEIGTNSAKWYKSDYFRLTYYTVKAGAAEAWAAAKTAAEAARDDAAYTNVTGSEKTTLLAEIEKAEPSTAEAYGTATTALQEATSAFTGAKDSYDGLIAKRTEAAAYTTVAWPYASTAKKTALDGAVAAAPTNAADAVTKTNAITTAIRQFVESNGVAENVAGAIDFASAIAGADPNTNTGWTGGIGVDNRDAEKYTDGDGNTSGKYYDGGWSASAGVNINMSRTLTLPEGRYLLQVTARGSGDLTSYAMSIGSESVDLPKEGAGSAAGTFGHGWSDRYVVFESDGSELTLAITATSTAYQQWISFNRFRLYNLGDATVSVTVSDAGFATYVPSYDLNFSETAIKAYTVKVNDPGVATLTQEDNVPAGTPVLLYADGGATEGIPVMTGAGAVGENDLVAGTGAGVPTYETVSTENDYTNMILNNGSEGIGFYFANGQTVAANRAYLHIATSLAPDVDAGSRMVMVFADEATGISTVKDAGSKVDGYYDLQGRRVTQPAKGLYIVNGKKVVIK